MSSKNKPEPTYKPGDLRTLKHCAAVLECSVATVRKLSGAGLNFQIIALNPAAEGNADPIYRVVWSTFQNWLKSRADYSERQTAKILKHLP